MALRNTPAWEALVAHQHELDATHLRDLFANDPLRADRLTTQVGDLTIDFSKHLATDTTLELLTQLAQATGFDDRREAMFSGARINTTEDRSALHTALRANSPVIVDGQDVVPEVRAVLTKMARVADQVRAGTWMGATGKPIRAVVNIGIGGSDLGPLMATKALRHLAPTDLTVRFVSNIDVAALNAALVDLDPETTMFVVASKTFTTIETMTNARSARAWLIAGVQDKDGIARHFVAVSTNAEGVAEFGIDANNMFEFWDWIGGRYSVGAAVGFSVMCAIGSKGFDEFLAGFRLIDDHFGSAPLTENAPAIAALLGIWYRNFWGWQTHAVLPYSQALDRFSAYLQQLDMESNGKRINLDGEPVDVDTAPIVWGEPGTNGQHAFYQLLHQGTTPVPCDFIGFLQPEPGHIDPAAAANHHQLLFANLVAQAEALAFGKTPDEVASAGVDPELVPHRTFPGNRPSTVITAPALTASVLGQLIAFYEHRVFTQGVVWGVNSFDQWGVELGKVLATAIGAELDGTPNPDAHDASTNALIARFRNH
ncbi:MAG: glucose-6-phosphate isomerase [Acidimicrobiales bacterium]|jgi:glucose-6-phosphate isomerase